MNLSSFFVTGSHVIKKVSFFILRKQEFLDKLAMDYHAKINKKIKETKMNVTFVFLGA